MIYHGKVDVFLLFLGCMVQLRLLEGSGQANWSSFLIALQDDAQLQLGVLDNCFGFGTRSLDVEGVDL